MKVIANEKVIKRNSKIGNYLNIGALVILASGMVLSFTNTEMIWYSFAALFVGFVLSQISFYFINRWGRKPRLDEQITQSLKGLPGEYSLYHYHTPASHLLVGPAGVWVLLPYYQRGKITYDGKKYRQSGGGFGLAYLKVFAQEGLARPELDVDAEKTAIEKFLAREMDGYTTSVNVALVFTDKRAEVDADNAPFPTMAADRLKDFIRKRAKEMPFPVEEVRKITAILPQEEKPEKK